MNNVVQVSDRGIPLVLDDIDTDRIIPARYLRCVTFDGLGEHAFEDDRQQDDQHPFDAERFQGAKILVTGRNFGCGSSREHAPQALIRWGIQAIVGESFAEIFFGNCISLGVAAVCAKREDLDKLAAAIENDPALQITVDLEAQEVVYGSERFACSIPESARSALVKGRYDFLAQLLDGEDAIRQRAEKLPYLTGFEVS